MTKTRKYFLMFVGAVLIFTHQQRNFVNQRHEIQVSIEQLRNESPSFKEKYDEVKAKKPDLTILPPNLTWIYDLIKKAIPPKFMSTISPYLPFQELEKENKAVTQFKEADPNFPELLNLPVGWDVKIIVDLNKIDSKDGLKAALAHEIYHAWETLEAHDIKAHLALKTAENSLPYENRPSEIAAKAFEEQVVSEIPSKKPINDNPEVSEELVEVDQ